jgi:hypothetical protein
MSMPNNKETCERDDKTIYEKHQEEMRKWVLSQLMKMSPIKPPKGE